MHASRQEEAAARVIAKSRGVDPDDEVIVGNADGTHHHFETAWHGYVALAREIEAARRAAGRKGAAK